jgi:ribonuclease Y
MNLYLYLIIGVLIGGLPGVLIGRFLLRKLFKDQEVAAQHKVKKILKDAENDSEILKKNKLLEAKERFLQLKAEHEQQINEKNNNINQRENGVKQKEQSLNSRVENMNRKESELDGVRQNLERQTQLVVKKQEEVGNYCRPFGRGCEEPVG